MATDFDEKALEGGTKKFVTTGAMHVNNKEYLPGSEIELPTERAEELHERGVLVTAEEWKHHTRNPEREQNLRDEQLRPTDHPVLSGGDGTDSPVGADTSKSANPESRESRHNTVANSQDGTRSTKKS